MPWSNQGGGGGGGGGPWGGSPQGGGQNPWGRGGGPSQADIEEMIRRGQDRFRQVMPKGFGGGRGILIAIVVIIVGWLLTGIYRVQPDELGVVQRFGAYVRTEQPGLRYHLPAPIETVTKPSVTTQNRIEIGFSSEGRAGNRDVPDESQMLTKDENIIDIDFIVLWRISDPVAYLFNIKNADGTVKVAAESAMREVIGNTEIQPALNEARGQIEQSARQLLQATLDGYGTPGRPGAGVVIDQVQLQKVAPPQQVIASFDDVQSARQNQDQLRNDAETYRNDVVPRARGQAEQVAQQAEGYREQVVARARGDAARFTSVLQSYRLAPEITAERFYLETLETVLKGSNKIMIDDAVGGQGVLPYLPLNELMGRPATATTQPGGK
ncbi:FtsH protease activity modulator HflK [Mycobacterium sp. KBS0706]|uniref:FtsH protease activity modulator HflK n=1 Tax=Mycobacterium sp. KBS0706 TaxID=2578109 RepID=UPI00110F7F09|nr:FtsH protease activity modulator HflK [Mycobacterium sp. KBS0706]TSD90392.1 FtsH protease activity modulator HflK [Mycobacterium sp. KBS0706]